MLHVLVAPISYFMLYCIRRAEDSAEAFIISGWCSRKEVKEVENEGDIV